MKIKKPGPAAGALLCLVLCILMMGGFAITANAVAKFYCPPKYFYIVFLIDDSASMDMRHKSLGINKLSLVRQILLQINDSVLFNESVVRGVVIQTFPGKMEPVPMEVYGSDVLAAKFAAVGKSRDDFPRLTNMGEAIARQFEAMPEKDVPIRLVLMSDGEYNRGESPVDVIRALQKQHDDLDVLVISLADTPEGEETLRRIANVIPGPNQMARAETLLDDREELHSLVSWTFCQVRACYFSDIFFSPGSAEIPREGGYLLQSVVDSVWNRQKPWTITISGHTDNTGNERANQRLSERRAQAAKDWLVQHGLPADKIETRGYGSSMPKYDSSTKDGRRMNRRVDLDYPIGGERSRFIK